MTKKVVQPVSKFQVGFRRHFGDQISARKEGAPSGDAPDPPGVVAHLVTLQSIRHSIDCLVQFSMWGIFSSTVVFGSCSIKEYLSRRAWQVFYRRSQIVERLFLPACPRYQKRLRHVPRSLEHPPRVVQKGAPPVAQFGQGGVEVGDDLRETFGRTRSGFNRKGRNGYLEFVVSPLDEFPQFSFDGRLVADLHVTVSGLGIQDLSEAGFKVFSSTPAQPTRMASTRGVFAIIKFSERYF